MIAEKQKFKVLYTFTCECVLQRNGVEVSLKNSTAKLKTFKLISLQQDDQPYIDTNFEIPIYVGNGNDVLHRIRLDKIKRLHTNFMKERKMTIEVIDDVQKSEQRHISSDICLKECLKEEKSLFIMIKNASEEILLNFVRMINDIKKKCIVASNNLKRSNSMQIEDPKPRDSLSQRDIQNQPQQANGLNSQSKKVQPFNGFKVDRNMLNNLNQKPQPQKRNFEVMKKDSQNLQLPKQETKRIKVSTQNPFKLLPDAVIIHIMKFLSQKEYVSQRLVCKTFHDVISGARTVLDLRGKGDVPPRVVMKYLNSCKNLTELYVGQSKHLSQHHFLNDITVTFNHLRLIDFSHFTNMSDKSIQKFYISCKTLEVVKLGYYSLITDKSIETISTYIRNLKGFYLKCQNKLNNEKKDKITDTAISKLLHENPNLEEVSFYITGSTFFTKAFDQEYPKLRKLKLDFIHLSKPEDLALLEGIGSCKNLQYLKIGSIRFNKFEAILSTKESEHFKNFLRNLENLQTIKFGAFTNNHILMHISNLTPDLGKLVLGTDSIDDDGLSQILRMAHSLNYLDISHCRTIAGHCLEDLVTRKLKRLIICADEYRCKCVEQVLIDKGLRGQTVLINISKAKF